MRLIENLDPDDALDLASDEIGRRIGDGPGRGALALLVLGRLLPDSQKKAPVQRNAPLPEGMTEPTFRHAGPNLR